MAVTEKDREYMRRLGEFIEEVNAGELSEHLASPVNQRLKKSDALSKRTRHEAASQDGKDLAAFFRRARKLGLIQS